MMYEMSARWTRAVVASAARAHLADASPEAREEGAAYCLAVFGTAQEAGPGAGDRPAAAADPLVAEAAADPLLVEMVAEVAGLRGQLPPEAVAARLSQVAARALARVRGRESAPPVRLRTARSAGDVWREWVERPHVGFFTVEQHRLRHRRFDGEMSPPIDRMVFASGDAVTVLPYDPRIDGVLLIEQFRAGPYARADTLPWCLEAIAGRCDADEDLEATARREAREEAGLELGRLERVLGYYPTPAIAAEHITSFVGEADLGGAGRGGVFGLESEHEDIRAFVVPRGEAEAALAAGEVNNAPLALSLMWLALNRERLALDWAGR